MKTFFRLLFFAATLAGIYVWLVRRQHEQQRQHYLAELTRLADQRGLNFKSSEETVQTAFFQSLYKAHEISEFLDATDTELPSVLATVSEALEKSGLSSSQAALVSDSLLDALRDLRVWGCLDSDANLQQLSQGKAPLITSGMFRGDRIRIGWRLSPIIVPEARNHFANLRVQPTTLWTLDPDKFDDTNYSFARRMRDADLISPELWNKIDVLMEKDNR